MKNSESEAGNIWFPEPKHPEPGMYTIFVYLCLIVGMLGSVAILAGAFGFVYQTFFKG